MPKFHITAADLAARGRLQRLCLDDGGAIGLTDMVLIEDDAPAIGQPEGATDYSWFEGLRSGIRLRKQLLIDDPRAASAWLLFCGREATDNDAPLHIRCNERTFIRPPTKVAHPELLHYYTEEWGGSQFDNWFVIEIPVAALKRGLNEIELWCEAPDVAWEVMVADEGESERGSENRPGHPNRSARSVDDGASWDDAHLGCKGEIDGEYCLRISLDQHASEGRFTSAVIDLAGELGILRGARQVTSAQLSWDLDLPDNTSVKIHVRFPDGALSNPHDAFQDWHPVRGAQIELSDPESRFLQFQIDFTTADARVSPRLRGFDIESAVATGGKASIHERSGHSGQIDLPAESFTWERPEALVRLREQFRLDEVTAGAVTEFDAQLRLMNWAYRVPLGRLNPYFWSFDDLPQLGEDGTPTLLPPYAEPRREGHCLFCNLTLVGALLSMGYPARWVNTSTKHTYGHEVAEVWSNDFDKWVFLDATRDYYIHDPDTGVPLDLMEISQRLGERVRVPVTWDHPVQGQLTDEAVPGRVNIAYRDRGRPLFSADESPHDLLYMGHVQMVLRNDFNSRPTPVPWRLTSNWGSDQFLCYYSDAFPRKREYDRHSNRGQDFAPRLNQTGLVVSAARGSEKDAAALLVEVETTMPWFEDFVVQIDEADSVAQARKNWTWTLHEGVNKLRVCSRNQLGVQGPWAHAELIYSP